jgi:hypothetical protein
VLASTSAAKASAHGIEFRTGEHYVILPPGRHVSGREYGWAKGDPIEEAASLPQPPRSIVEWAIDVKAGEKKEKKNDEKTVEKWAPSVRIGEGGGTTVDDDGRSLDETADMTTWLIDRGVPAEAIATGRPGDNTRQTVATMGRLTREQGLHPWLAVSSPFHARRILDEAKRVGIDVAVSGPGDSPVTSTPHIRRFQLLIEVLATTYYAMPPTLTARTRTPLTSVRRRIAEYLIRNEE